MRIRILEILRDGATDVTEIWLPTASRVGGSTHSQHPARLRRAGFVGSRRSGSNVIYRVVDSRVFQLLEIGRQILTSSLADSAALIADLEQTDIEVGH